MGLLDDAIREHLDLKRRRGADPTEIEKAERDALGPVRRDATSTALSDPESPAASAPAPSEEFDFELAATFGDGGDDRGAEDATMVAPPVAPFEGETDQAPAGIAEPAIDDPAFDDFAATEAPAAELPSPPADFDLPSERPIEAPEPRHKRRHLFGRHRHDHDFDVEPADAAPRPAELPADDPFLDPPGPPAKRETALGESVGPAQPMKADAPPRREAPPTLRITPEAELGHTVEYDVEQAFAEEDQADEDILEETPDFLADTPDHDRLWFEQKPPPDFDFDN